MIVESPSALENDDPNERVTLIVICKMSYTILLQRYFVDFNNARRLRFIEVTVMQSKLANDIQILTQRHPVCSSSWTCRESVSVGEWVTLR